MPAEPIEPIVPATAEAAGGEYAQGEDKPERKPTVWKRRTTMGAYGPETAAAIYQLGAPIRPQLVRWLRVTLRISEKAVDRQLRHLREAGLIALAADKASWQRGTKGWSARSRPHSAYYLTAAGVRVGAAEHGIESAKAALRAQRRVDVPGKTAHRAAANEPLVALLEKASEKGSGVEFPVDEAWCEACPDFPVFGEARPQPGAPAWKFDWVTRVPDSTFVLVWERPAGLRQQFFLEMETGVKKGVVLDKVLAYASRWRRILVPRNEGEARWHAPSARLEPLVIVAKNAAQARTLQLMLHERLRDALGWAAAKEAFAASVPEGEKPVEPGQLVLLVGWEEVREDPLGRVYRPVREYPQSAGGYRVGLRDAAEVAGRVRPKETKSEVEERLKAEAKAAKEEEEEEEAL